MEKYILRLTFDKDGSNQTFSIITEALTDEEALRAAHPPADLAEWDGATNVRVSVSSRDGRAVGFVGDDGSEAIWLGRPTTRARSYKGE